MDASTGVSEIVCFDKPQQADLDKCVHCGLFLNACPTYRELHIEMDSPRGRIFQMKQVAAGAPITESYIRHLDLCLACRGCETACPSGVSYGRLIEAARTQIHQVLAVRDDNGTSGLPLRPDWEPEPEPAHASRN